MMSQFSCTPSDGVIQKDGNKDGHVSEKMMEKSDLEINEECNQIVNPIFMIS